LLKEMRVKE